MDGVLGGGEDRLTNKQVLCVVSALIDVGILSVNC